MNVGEFTIKIDTSPIDEAQAKAEKLEATLLRIKELGSAALVAGESLQPLLDEVKGMRSEINAVIRHSRSIEEGEILTSKKFSEWAKGALADSKQCPPTA